MASPVPLGTDIRSLAMKAIRLRMLLDHICTVTERANGRMCMHGANVRDKCNNYIETFFIIHSDTNIIS